MCHNYKKLKRGGIEMSKKKKKNPGRITKGKKRMRARIKQWLMFAGILGMTLMLSGCFFSEQTLVIGPDGKADIKVEFWFDKIQAGDQGSIAMQELLYLFPELQDYETTRAEKDIGYTTHIGYRFQAKDVDINKNQYIDFVKKDDGSYSLIITIPKAIEEKKESNDKVLTIKVTMPAEIDMANTMNYEGRTAEWELRTNDFARDIILKAFTKASLERETKQEPKEEISYLSTPENIVKTYYEAIFLKQDKSLAKACYSKATSLLLEEVISPPAEMKNRLEDKGIGFASYTQKILTATYSIDKDWLEGSADPENERLVKVEFNEELLNWKVVKEGGEWKIAMPVAITQEQGEIWLERTSEIQSFFDLSAPENTLKSFIEAAALGNKEQAEKCWSNQIPSSLVEEFINSFVKGLKDAHPEFLKFLVRATHYGSEKINEDNYYVFRIPPGSKKRGEALVFRVTRENDYWKILMPKSMEDDPDLNILWEILGID